MPPGGGWVTIKLLGWEGRSWGARMCLWMGAARRLMGEDPIGPNGPVTGGWPLGVEAVLLVQ